MQVIVIPPYKIHLSPSVFLSINLMTVVDKLSVFATSMILRLTPLIICRCSRRFSENIINNLHS